MFKPQDSAPNHVLMKHRNFYFALCILLMAACSMVPSHATVDDALSFSLEAADPYVREGFAVREDYWGGDLAVKEAKTLPHQLFKGLEYWFWLGTDIESAKVSVHIYDKEGNLAEVEHFQKGHLAGARILPKRTGTFYIVVTIEASPEERTPWGLAYGYR
jgi:hypothetical protein